MGSVDHNQYNKCDNVGDLCVAWRGPCNGYGHHVDLLSVEFNQRVQGVAEAQRKVEITVNFYFSFFFT